MGGGGNAVKDSTTLYLL